MPPVDEILYSWGPGESRLALIAGGRVVEFIIHRDGATAAGGIWLGRVVGVNKALGAAFVEIGLGQPGFLAGEAVTEGQAVLVQARSDGHGGKGPKLTANVSLPGALVAYSPKRPGIALSRRIGDPAERERLTTLAERLSFPGEGLVLRTGAAGADDEALAAEIARLRTDWQAIAERAKGAKAPACLLAPEPLAAVLADNPGVRRVLVDDAAAFAELRGRYPQIVAHHRHGPLFALHDADEEFERALQPVVPLKSGGTLVIESTAALTAIDVNSGGETATQANMEAAVEIARQLRLRGIGGQIVADFIPVRQRGHLPQVAVALRKAAKDDPVPVDVLGVTSLGLIEITRERRRASLGESLLQTAAVKTAETLALEALRAILAEPAKAGRPVIVAAPDVVRALERLKEPVAEAGRRLGVQLTLRADAARPRDSFDLRWE